MPERFLTPNDAVTQSERSRDHVHRALNSGALKATQAYKHAPWQITQSDLTEWIDSGRPARPIPRDDAGTPPNVPTFEEVDPECATPESRATGGGESPLARTAGADDEHPSAPAPGAYRERGAA